MTPNTAIPAAGEAVPANLDNELPVDRVGRLASELSRALDTYANGSMHAEIHPASKQPFAIRLIVSRFDIPDPLITAIEAYKRGHERFMAVPDEDLVAGDESAIMEQFYGAEQQALLNWDQPARTAKGAIAALQFMGESDYFVDDFTVPLRRAVIGFLEALG